MNVFRGLVFGLLLVVGGAVTASAGVETSERTDTISVPHMQCGMCENKISKKLEKLEGVVSVEADAEQDIVIVRYNPSALTLATLEEAIAAVGYDAGETMTTPEAQKKLHGCCKPSE